MDTDFNPEGGCYEMIHKCLFWRGKRLKIVGFENRRKSYVWKDRCGMRNRAVETGVLSHSAFERILRGPSRFQFERGRLCPVKSETQLLNFVTPSGGADTQIDTDFLATK